MCTNTEHNNFEICHVKCFCLQIDVIQSKGYFCYFGKMLTNFSMQVSDVSTIQTAVFLHYSTDQQAQSWTQSHETRNLNLFQYFEVNDTFLCAVFLTISLVFWWAQTSPKLQRTVQMILTILGKATGFQ